MSTPQRQERVATAYDALGTLRDEMDTLRRERDAARRAGEIAAQDLKEARRELTEAQQQLSLDGRALQQAHEQLGRELKARSSLHQSNQKLRERLQKESTEHAKTAEQLNTQCSLLHGGATRRTDLVVMEKLHHDRLRALLWHYMQRCDASEAWFGQPPTAQEVEAIKERNSVHAPSRNTASGEGTVPETSLPVLLPTQASFVPVMSAPVLANDDSATAPLLAKLLDTTFEDGMMIVRDEFMFFNPAALPAILPTLATGAVSVMISSVSPDGDSPIVRLLDTTYEDGTPVVRNLNWVQACKDCERRDIADRCTHIVRPPQHVRYEVVVSTDTTTKTATHRLIDGGFKICTGCNCWAKVSRGIDAYTRFFCDVGCREKWLNQTPRVSGR